MNLEDLRPPADLPVADAQVPALAVRGALAVAGIALTLVVWGASGWIALGVVLSVVAALLPDFLLGWLLVLFLAVGQLQDHATLRWQLLVLVAGVHLLHVLSLLALELPWRSWVQPAVLRAPLLRYVAIQVPCQVIALIAMSLLGQDGHGRREVSVAGFALIGALALAGLAVLMLSGLRRPRLAGAEEP